MVKDITAYAYKKSTGERITVHAKVAANEIDYLDIKAKCEKAKSNLQENITKINNSLNNDINLGEDVLLIQDKNMKNAINDYSKSLNDIKKNISNALDEFCDAALDKHDELQIEYNTEARQEAYRQANSE